MRKMGMVLMVVCLMTLLAPCDEVDAGRRAESVGVWWSADSTWGIRMSKVLGLEHLLRLWEERPERVTGWLMFEVWSREEGEWFWIRMRLKSVKSVTFTKNTRIVVTKKEGRRVESEGVFFWPDMYQTSLYDSRKMCVVVTNSAVWRGSDGRGPTGCVKFAAGCVRVGDVSGFEVVGAIEEAGGGEAK